MKRILFFLLFLLSIANKVFIAMVLVPIRMLNAHQKIGKTLSKSVLDQKKKNRLLSLVIKMA